MKFFLASAVLLAATAPSFAQHAHSKGPNGGALEDVAGIHAEFLSDGNKMTFNLLDEASKPVPVSGYTGAVLVVSGSNRETLTLTPRGASALQGEAKAPVAAGTAITLNLKGPDGKSGQARFKK